jgi:hypothetical protein
VWVLSLAVRVGVGGGGVAGVGSLLGRAPEAIRNLPGGQAAVVSAAGRFCIAPLA